MALTEFSPINCLTARATYPGITVAVKSGVMMLNEHACELLQATSGGGVKLFQDEDNPQDWYVVFGPEDGFALRSKADAKGLFFNNTYLARLIADSLGIESGSFKMGVGSEITEIEGVGNAFPLLFVKKK